jgi:tetratricopeptide (TPR) repeat protein
MALDRLREALETRFDKEAVRSLIASYRGVPLLWKELNLHDLPDGWLEFAGNEFEKWQPGLLSLAVLDPNMAYEDFRDLGKTLPTDLTELAGKVRNTISLTGLEPANLRDATSLSLELRKLRSANGSWQGLSQTLADGKTSLGAWKCAFLALPWLSADSLEALKALTQNPGSFTREEVALFLVDLVQTMPANEKEQYDLLSKVLEEAEIALQVQVLGKLRGKFEPSFIELLANSFLIRQNRSRDLTEDQSQEERIETHQNLAMLNQFAGKADKAHAELDQAIAGIRRNQAFMLRKLALEYEEVNPEEARKIWEQVLELEPENPAHRRDYAEFLVKQNEPDFALGLLNQHPDEATTALLALRYPELREQTDEVTQALDKVISRRTLPELASRYVGESDNFKAAEYAFEQKKYNLASDFIHKALDEHPNDIEIIRLAAKIDQRLANLDEAIESSALLAMFEPENKTNNRELARLYQQTQQETKALEVYQDLIFDQDQVDREDFLNYSEIAIKAGKPELAIPIAEGYLNKDQLDGEAFVLLSRAMIASGRKTEALELLERTSALAPEKPASWLALAQIWIELDDRNQAMLALRKAKAALPGEPKILTTLGKLYLENEETTDAIAVLRQAAQADPANSEAARLLAEAWLRQGYLSEAWQALAPFEEDYASDPELALTLGKVALANQEITPALKMLKFSWQSLKRDDALTAYAEALLRVNEKYPNRNQTELAALLDAIHHNEPAAKDEFEFDMLKTDLKAANGIDEEAYSEYLKLLDNPRSKSPRTYHHLQSQIGKTARRLGLKDIALASLQEAMMVDPDNLDTRHILAAAYLDSDLRDEAFNTARAALQIAPSDVENLLWFSGFMNEQHNEKETIQVLRDALHLRPENETLYLTLARTYAAAGELAETKETLNKMLTLETMTTKEYIDVANLYLKLNETEEASAVILKALSNNPEPDFEETKDLVYSILRLGDAEAALRLVTDLGDHLGAHPCYQILLSDVQVANKEFISALDNLNEMLQKIEFAAEEECFASQQYSESNRDFPPYDKAGFYYRLAQLERVTGDLLAAQKHADLAQKADPESRAILVTQAGLALSLLNNQKLDFALDFLDPEPNSGSHSDQLARILALEAAVQNDSQKLSMLWDYFISKQSPSAFREAASAYLRAEGKQPEDPSQQAPQANDLLEPQAKTAFSIEKHFDWVLENLMTFLAAWKSKDWRAANLSIKNALSVARVNPLANRLLAAYLSDNYRQHNNAMLLHITRHAPQRFTEDDTLEILEEQIALAGRYLKPSDLLPVLKVGQAVLNGHWDENEEMQKLVLNPCQAACVLSVLVSQQRIDEISDAFGNDAEVLEQKAILSLHDQPENSVAIADRLLQTDPRNPVLLAIKALALRGKPTEAASSIESALEIWPDEAEWHAFASNMYQDLGDYPKSAAHLEEALKTAPKSAHYWQLLGDVKLLEKDYLAAKDYFGKASDLFPDNPEALNSLAQINQQLGEHVIAIQCWQKAHQLDPENPKYKISIAESHLARKEFDQAIEQADQVLFSHPGNERALWLIASAQLQSGNKQLAKKSIDNARLIAADPVPFELLSIDLYSPDQPTLVLSALKKLAEKYPDNVSVLNRLAACQIDSGFPEKANITLNNSLTIDGENAETLILLGKIDRLTGNLDQAIAHLSQALRLDPSKIDAYLEMGQTYQDRREVDLAIEVYRKAIEMVAKDPRPYVQASAAYKESRDYRNAEFMLRQAAQLSPSDQGIRRQLAAIVALNLVNNLQEAPKRK